MKQLIIMLSLSAFAACNNSDKSTQTSITDTTRSIMNSNNKSINEQPAKTIVGFIVWYRNNYKSINNITMVNNSRVYDSTKFYSVNFEGTEEYLKEIKNSGFVSDKYIDNWRQYFKKCDAYFKSNHQNDGPPTGFEYDFVMNGQDYEKELNDVEKSTVEEMNGNNTMKTVKLKFNTGTTLNYDLSFKNNKWYIDKIY